MLQAIQIQTSPNEVKENKARGKKFASGQLTFIFLDQEQQNINLMDIFNICPAEEVVPLMDGFMSYRRTFLALGLDEKSFNADDSSFPKATFSHGR